MRAFLVDPKTQTVDEVDFDGSQAQLCYLLGLQIVPVGNPGIRGCSAALDMHSETRLFLYGKGRRHLYALALLFCGEERHQMVSAPITLEQAKENMSGQSSSRWRGAWPRRSFAARRDHIGTP